MLAASFRLAVSLSKKSLQFSPVYLSDSVLIASPRPGKMAQKFVEDQVANNKVVVFSKSYCPFCKMAKQAIRDAGLKDFTIIELEDRDDCSAIQDVLNKLTGARSVPRVFIGGKFVGGGSDVQQLQADGKLTQLIKDAGAL